MTEVKMSSKEVDLFVQYLQDACGKSIAALKKIITLHPEVAELEEVIAFERINTKLREFRSVMEAREAMK